LRQRKGGKGDGDPLVEESYAEREDFFGKNPQKKRAYVRNCSGHLSKKKKKDYYERRKRREAAWRDDEDRFRTRLF